MPTTLTQIERRTLAARATTLDERLAGHVEPCRDGAATALTSPKVKTWLTTASGDDARVLEKVLNERCTDLGTVTRAFGPVSLPDDLPLPAWIDTFCWILDALDRPADATSVSDPDVPFKPFYAGLLAEARRHRDRMLSVDATAHFSESALDDLDRDLENAAASVCSRGLLDAFTLARHLSGGMLGSKGAEAAQVTDTDWFAVNLKGPKLKAFFLDRPVIARLLATVTEQWIDVSARFITRLCRDRTSCIATLTGEVEPGRAANIGCGLSDRHRGGQSVYKVTFEGGKTVGYKPKDLSVDAAFNSLLDWMETDGAPASAGTVEVRPRAGYGWVEWVQHASCRDESEARTFFHRSGAMLCLIRMLQGNDFHFENVVAKGCIPVPIDLETITHPRIGETRPEFQSEIAFFRAMHLLGDSVANVGYLPNCIPVPGGGVVKVGGLDDYNETAGSGANEASEESKINSNPNLPSLNGKALSVNRFHEDFLYGYRAMFAYIAENGSRIAAPGGPLDGFENCLIRPVLRATRTYGMIQYRSLARRMVVDGASWSGQFDMLSRISLTATGEDPLGVLCRYERKAMAEFDIPFYQASTSSADLICGDGEVIQDFFEAPCLETVRERFRTAPENLLHRDEILIERSLCSGQKVTARPAIGYAGTAPVSASGLVSQAIGLGEAISKSAIGAGGAKTWIDMVPVTADERMCQPQALGPSLLAGTDGIALFFADLYAATGDPRWRLEAAAASAFATEQAEDPGRLQMISMLLPLGMGTGIGGLIHAQTALAAAFEDDRHLQAAHRYAGTITDTRIEEAKDFSQYQGLAGAVSALVGLYRVDPCPLIAGKISKAAQRLAAARAGVDPEVPGWADAGWHLPQIGPVNGASGIALALCEAHSVTSEADFLEAARCALAYENRLFDKFGGWPDLRDVENLDQAGTAPMGAEFATGAAGIGLARLSLVRFDVLDKKALRQDLQQAAEIVRKAPGAGVDGLFNGTAGRALFLGRAAVQMAGTVELLAGPQMLTCMLEEAEERGGLSWASGDDGDNPSVLHGAAGVGAALLECAGEAHATRALTFCATGAFDTKTRMTRQTSSAA